MCRSLLQLALPALLLLCAQRAWAEKIHDVTDKVIAAVKGNALMIKADNVTFGDPAYRQPKQLRVEYSVGETVRTNTVNENAVLKIEQTPGKRLIILKATYGVL